MDPNSYHGYYSSAYYPSSYASLYYPSSYAGWQLPTMPFWGLPNIDWKDLAPGLKREWWQFPTVVPPGPPLPPLPPLSSETTQSMQPYIDWKETPNAHVFIADVPGVGREEVSVRVGGGRMLQICWEQKRDNGGGDRWYETWCLTERSTGSFFRDISLPRDADENEVSVAVENGVLTVTVAKQGQKMPVVTTVAKQEEEKPETTVEEQEEEKPDVKPIEASDGEFDFVVV